jgi:hypothetical protein
METLTGKVIYRHGYRIRSSRIACSTGCIGSQNTGYTSPFAGVYVKVGTVSSGHFAINLPLVSRCCPPLVGVAVKVTVVAGTNSSGIGCSYGNTDR